MRRATLPSAGATRRSRWVTSRPRGGAPPSRWRSSPCLPGEPAFEAGAGPSLAGASPPSGRLAHLSGYPVHWLGGFPIPMGGAPVRMASVSPPDGEGAHRAGMLPIRLATGKAKGECCLSRWGSPLEREGLPDSGLGSPRGRDGRSSGVEELPGVLSRPAGKVSGRSRKVSRPSGKDSGRSGILSRSPGRVSR